MSVANGQTANQTTFNNAYLSKTTDSTTVGVIGLNNTTDPDSGNPITNTQRYQNEIADSDGTVGVGDTTRKDYSSNNVVADGDSRKVAIGKLDATFDPVTGHNHDGVNSPLIVSGGAGGSGVNFLTLDSAWAPNNTDNFNAEFGLGQWLTFNNQSTAGIIAQDLSAFTSAFGITNTLAQAGQQFTAAISGTTDEVTFQMNNPGAAMSGNIVCKIYDDAAGSPGTLLATSDNYDSSTLSASPADVLFNFTTPASLGSGFVYHAVIDFSGVTFGGGNINVVYNNTDPYAGGDAETSNDGGVTWTPQTGDDLYFKVESTAAASDLTLQGGSSSLVLSRTTTGGEVLDGSASFKVVKGAVNAENQGISCTAYIPLGYRGQIASIQFPFKILSGSLVGGDLKAVVYDVTNSELIIPINDDATSSGIAKMTFYIPATTEEIRFGLYFASSSATAVTYVIDDVQVGPQELVYGPSMTDVKSDLSFTPVNFGTLTDEEYFYKYNGDTLEATGYFVPGTLAAAIGYIQLPSGIVIDTSKMPVGVGGTAVGLLASGAASATDLWTGGYEQIIFFDGSDTDKLYFASNADAGALNKRNVDASFSGTPGSCSFRFKIPVVGASTNVVTQNTTSFWLSSILANGTRVTGAPPSKFGEYQSFLRNAGTQVYTETNGAPSSAPNTSDGIKIWHASSYAGGDANNEPSKYIFFVGKNKEPGKIHASLNAGKTGFLDMSLHNYDGSHAGGVVQNYDSTTGLLELFCNTFGGVGIQYVGIDGTNSPITGSPGYFDFLISEKVIPVQSITNQVYQSQSSAAFTTTSGTPVDVTNLTLDVPCVAGVPVSLWLQSDNSGNNSFVGCGGGLASFQTQIIYFFRNGVEIGRELMQIATTPFGSYSYLPSSSFRFTDINPPAGTNTYKIQTDASNTTSNVAYTTLCARVG